jgi:hypothetical protein
MTDTLDTPYSILDMFLKKRFDVWYDTWYTNPVGVLHFWFLVVLCKILSIMYLCFDRHWINNGCHWTYFKEKSYEVGGTTAWHGCIDHMLELITKLTFKDLPNSSGTMSACHSLVNFLNSSSQASSKLKDTSKAMLGTSSIQDVCTCWWSTIWSSVGSCLRFDFTFEAIHGGTEVVGRRIICYNKSYTFFDV